MLSYTEICESNRHLYSLLEQFTERIDFCLSCDKIDEANALKIQKEGIRDMINNNLEKLEVLLPSEIWHPDVRKAVRLMPYELATRKEKSIIKVHLDNIGMDIKGIAALCVVSPDTVSRVLTTYIIKKHDRLPNGEI